MTAAERASRRAVAAATASRILRGPGGRAAGSSRNALRTRTGLLLAALGLILLLAVHVRIGFIETQPAGLVLLGTGMAWLWLPVHGKGVLPRRLFDRVMAYLSWADGTADDARCSLAELLEPPAPAAPACARAAPAQPVASDQHDG